MPSTPNFAIPYPCSGDTIDCGVFENFTQAIQTALSTVNTAADDALNRPTAIVRGTSAQTVAVAVSTNAVFDIEVFDNAAMVDLAANNTRITITSDGIYIVSAWLDLGSGFTTITSNAVAITLNGTVLYRKKNSSDTNLDMGVSVTGLVNCVAGDILRTSILWTGTGGPADVFETRMSAARINRT